MKQVLTGWTGLVLLSVGLVAGPVVFAKKIDNKSHQSAANADRVVLKAGKKSKFEVTRIKKAGWLGSSYVYEFKPLKNNKRGPASEEGHGAAMDEQQEQAGPQKSSTPSFEDAVKACEGELRANIDIVAAFKGSGLGSALDGVYQSKPEVKTVEANRPRLQQYYRSYSQYLAERELASNLQPNRIEMRASDAGVAIDLLANGHPDALSALGVQSKEARDKLVAASKQFQQRDLFGWEASFERHAEMKQRIEKIRQTHRDLQQAKGDRDINKSYAQSGKEFESAIRWLRTEAFKVRDYLRKNENNREALCADKGVAYALDLNAFSSELYALADTVFWSSHTTAEKIQAEISKVDSTMTDAMRGVAAKLGPVLRITDWLAGTTNSMFNEPESVVTMAAEEIMNSPRFQSLVESVSKARPDQVEGIKQEYLKNVRVPEFK